jgi:hypothetical protein
MSSPDARPSPIPDANAVMPFVNPQTGALTEYGLQLLQSWRGNMLGAARVIVCDATGTNFVTLTPASPRPLIESYIDHDIFVFKATGSSTGVVTGTVVPDDGVLATVKFYSNDGSTQANNGSLVAGNIYLGVFDAGADSGAGGIIIK